MLKKSLALLFAAALGFHIFTITAYCDEMPSLSAASAVLITADTKDVLYSKSPNEKRPVASTTKIMTALLAVEYGELQKTAIADSASVNTEGTSIGLKEGDRISLETLILAMLLESGNDAANLTARTVSCDVGAFCELMNKKARLLGMENTHFSNPSGLPCDDHYSTAYDMALLGAFAIGNPQFSSMCSLKTASVSYGNPEITRTFKNHNRLLSSCDGVFGIKTGFTKAAGRCLVSAAERDGITLVAVTLNAPDDWRDHERLYEYGFKQVEKSPWISGNELYFDVAGAKKPQIKARVSPDYYTSSGSSDYSVSLLKENALFAPIKKGDVVGKAVLKDSFGKDVLFADIVACEDAPALPVNEKSAEKKQSFLEKILSFIKGIFK